MDADPGGNVARRRGAIALRVLGVVIAVTAVALCVRTLVVEWPQISSSLATADLRWIAGAAACAAAGLWFLALLWHQCLRVFGTPTRLWPTTAWFFAGELGKYLPGGIWPVVGRGELAHRGGVGRSVAYTTTMVSLGLMCVGGAIACALFAPFLAGDGFTVGPELLVLLIIPIGVVAVHPAVFGPMLRLVKRLSKGRIDLLPPPWRRMIALIGLAVPTWLLIGVSSAMITAGLGYGQQPGRVAFAAVAAWIVGFLAVPVPAGAGVREVVFVYVCGLPAGPAVAVAAVARVMFVVIDAIGGVTSLIWLRTDRKSTSGDRSVVIVD